MADSKKENNKMENIIALCKRRGFVYQSSEIYGGLAGMWDYGPYGVALRNNIKKLWWKRFVDDREDMYGVDASILMRQEVWQASGHARGFADMLVDCTKCKRRFRVDHLENKEVCPECGGKLGEARQFYMMLETHLGAVQDESSLSYLRPETAQGMFVNFKNIVDSFHPKLPFGMAQIGKAFRNEIAPRDFIFRLRELEQMEIEYFVRPTDWEKYFEEFRLQMHEWVKDIGLQKPHVHEIEINAEDRAHYSKRTIDFEFDFPFGQKELYGLAYRTDYDLTAHKLDYLDEETKTRIIPHVIEPSFGLDRTMLAILSDAYTEDELGGEVRTYLKLSPKIAPVKVAVFPLLKNKPELVAKAREVFAMLKKEIGAVEFDDNGNIGKRYRRQDEIGTPYCITIDFDTIEKDAGVTVRDRDTGKQERVALEEISKKLQGIV
ncbi:MAG: glycine--tRNA ligase [Candidatus Pacebacteria bacterium]|nr:glycine--tRNA ligase [Candidatus Paceibacterota bacterium]MDD5356942.1 glycine--tRNA ligase [Candidatus Paceibacterota bacterium]